MNIDSLPYLIPYIISLIITSGVGVFAWQRRQVAAATPFAIAVFAQASMTLGYIFELASTTLPVKLFWDNFQWLGTLIIPPALLMFALTYSDRRPTRPIRAWGWLLAFPFLFYILVFTNGAHELVGANFQLLPGSPFASLVYDFGTVSYLGTLYIYGLTLVAFYFLWTVFRRSQGIYRAQVAAILVGNFLPMIGGILTIAGITLTSQRDTTPLTFAVSNVIIAWGLFRYRFLDVAPVARGTVVENMRDAVIVLDNQHQVVDINPAGRILLPQANKAVIGMPVTQLFADWSDIVSKYIKAENVSEELMINTDDNRQYFELNISPILGNRSDHLGRVVVLRDITSRKMAEEALQQRTRDLKLSSEVARQVTTQLDLQQLLSQLVEQTRATFDLYFVAVFIYHEDTEQLVLAAGTGEAGRYMLENEISFHIEARPSLVAKAGREKQNVIINDVIIEDAHFYNPNLPDTQSEIVLPMLVGDKLIGVLGFQSEIKNRFTPADMEIFSTLAEQIAIAINNAQLYARQAELAEELLQADEMKSQFLASMSHELRTPLNAIMNFTEMITTGLMGPVNDEQRELLDQSLESSKHLLNLINDVLDISKIQAGKLSLFIENDVNLYTELKTVVGMMEPMLKGRPVKLVQDIDDNLPLLIGDKRRIRQILLNLASNAAKFTDEGSITLSAKNRGDHIQVAVIDCGPGISAEMQEIIFEPFMQTADGVKHAEGTGLGLPITKSLVTAHNGRIWLESEPGEGAAFYVTLPVNGVRS